MTTPASTAITAPSTIRRRSAWRHRRACTWRRGGRGPQGLGFGPLVYTLALYHPLRLAEEICMLDQMSRGRFLLGIGKGISPIEVGYYGIDYKNADRMFPESFAVIRQALTQKTV